MEIEGEYFRDGKWWVADIPILDAITPAKTRKGLGEMVEDLVESLVNRTGFETSVVLRSDGTLRVRSSDQNLLFGITLKRLRQKSGLTLVQAAARLGSSSQNSIARYEKGACSPTLEKVEELLRAVSVEKTITLRVDSRSEPGL